MTVSGSASSSSFPLFVPAVSTAEGEPVASFLVDRIKANAEIDLCIRPVPLEPSPPSISRCHCLTSAKICAHVNRRGRRNYVWKGTLSSAEMIGHRGCA